jgi:hypothetical protein
MTTRATEVRFPLRTVSGARAGGILLVLLILFALLWARAAESAANANGRDRWGPFTVGDRIGIKEVGSFYELQVAPRAAGGVGYRLQQIAVTEGTTFLVLTPPDELRLAPGLVKEIWIPASAVRSVQVR